MVRVEFDNAHEELSVGPSTVNTQQMINNYSDYCFSSSSFSTKLVLT